MSSSNPVGPSAGEVNNNEVPEELPIEVVRAIVAADEKRSRVGVMSSDSDEENVVSGSRQSNATIEASTVSAGVTGRGVEDALHASQLYSLVSTCSDPILLPELLSELSFLHLRPDEYPAFLEYVASFHSRAESMEVPASVMRDMSKFLRGHFCKYPISCLQFVDKGGGVSVPCCNGR